MYNYLLFIIYYLLFIIYYLLFIYLCLFCWHWFTCIGQVFVVTGWESRRLVITNMCFSISQLSRRQDVTWLDWLEEHNSWRLGIFYGMSCSLVNGLRQMVWLTASREDNMRFGNLLCRQVSPPIADMAVQHALCYCNSKIPYAM